MFNFYFRYDQLQQPAYGLLHAQYGGIHGTGPDAPVASNGAETPVNSFDLAFPGLGIRAFHVTAFALGERRTYVTSKKSALPMIADAISPQLVVRADKSRYGYNTRIDKQFTHLGDPAYILHPVLRREPEIIVDTTTDIIPVEDAAKQSLFMQLTLQGDSDRAFPEPLKPVNHTITPLCPRSASFIPHDPAGRKSDRYYFLKLPYHRYYKHGDQERDQVQGQAHLHEIRELIASHALYDQGWSGSRSAY